MLHWLRNRLRTPQQGTSETIFQKLRALKARYDAATTTDENRRHWQHADDLSANAANSCEVRKILRMRCRYEIANNSYARGLVLTLANDVVGTGPRLQMLTSSTIANRKIEQEFAKWSKAVRLAEKLRTMRMARVADGESFAILTSNSKIPGEIKLDLKLVEAEQVTSPDLKTFRENEIDGIKLDEFGNPVEYQVLRQHPGSLWGALSLKFDPIPAEDMIHYYRTDRPGQARGIPDITPALPLFAQLRRYTLAVLTAAEIAALPSGILYTDAPANGESEAVEPMDTISLERGTLLTMPGGWKMSQMAAQFPTTTYGEFKREILGEIGRALLLPVNILTGDSSRHNYASGRLDHQTYFKSIRVEQSHLETVVMDRILTAWLTEARHIPGLLPADIELGSLLFRCWMWDGTSHVDPLKEANAQAVRLASYTTTLADEYARMGLDWETQLRQRAKELTLMSELGLTETEPDSVDDEELEDEPQTENEETIPNAA